MSIQNEINRISHNISTAYAAVEGKGGTIPAQRNSGNLTAAINSIPEGGGITSDQISKITVLTEQEYTDLDPKEETTLYLIKE